MPVTTIKIDSELRDALKRQGHKGDTYNDIISRLLMESERDRFFEEIRDIVRNPDDYKWVGLEDME